jgi:hypothetical protein
VYTESISGPHHLNNNNNNNIEYSISSFGHCVTYLDSLCVKVRTKASKDNKEELEGIKSEAVKDVTLSSEILRRSSNMKVPSFVAFLILPCKYIASSTLIVLHNLRKAKLGLFVTQIQ